MKRLLFTFLALCLAVAGSAQSGQMTSKLPTIDITKEYPKKKLVLQDIATAEYIPLETSDKVLLDGMYSAVAISCNTNFFFGYSLVISIVGSLEVICPD